MDVNRWVLLLGGGSALALGVPGWGCGGSGEDDDDDADDDATADDDDAADDDATADDDTTATPVAPPGYDGTNGLAIQLDDGTVVTRDGIVTAWVNSYGQMDLRIGVSDDIEVDVKGPASSLDGDVTWATNQNDGMQVIVVFGAASGLTETYGTTLIHTGGSDTGGTGNWSDVPEASGHGAGTFDGIVKSMDGLHYAGISAAFDTDFDAH